MNLSQQIVQRGIDQMSIRPETEFDLFINSLDIAALETAINLPISDDDKRITIGYIITRRLEGININFSKKNHATRYARVLISHGAEIKTVANKLEITEKTLKKFKEDN